MKASDLKPNERNPRTITAGRKEGLRQSVAEYGDLGGIVWNRRDGKLYGGHQRVGVVDPNAPIEIVKEYKKPTKSGTVAEGYLVHGGERFSVRIVDWPAKKAAGAMIAANQHRGEWDKEILALEIKEHGLFEDGAGAMLGFDEHEMDLFLSTPASSPYASEQFESEVATPARADAAAQAAERAAVLAAAEDARPEPTAEDAHNAFDAITEKTEIEGKRQVIILDFERQDMKEAFKHKLRSEDFEAKFGFKIF